MPRKLIIEVEIPDESAQTMVSFEDLLTTLSGPTHLGWLGTITKVSGDKPPAPPKED